MQSTVHAHDTGAATAGRHGGDVVHVLRILDYCLYCPALGAVASIRAERNQLICSAFALSWAPAALHKGELAGGEETAESSTKSQAHDQLLADLRCFPVSLRTAVRRVSSLRGRSNLCGFPRRPILCGHLDSDLRRTGRN